MKPGLDQYYQPSPGTVGQLLDNEAVLLRPGAGKVSVLNDVGARIWQLADGTRSIREIALAITQEFRVDQGQAQADTIEFIELLVQKGILVAVDPPTA